MLEVAEGLLYIHSEGIVHGDLHGVSIVLDDVPRLFMSFTREMSSLTRIFTAKLLILDQRDISKPPLRNLQQLFL